MSRRKGFRAFWKAEGELGRTALRAAGHLFRALYCEIKNFITTFKQKRNEKENQFVYYGRYYGKNR